MADAGCAVGTAGGAPGRYAHAGCGSPERRKLKHIVLWVVCFLASCVEMGSKSKPNVQFLAPHSHHSGSGGCQGGPEKQHK